MNALLFERPIWFATGPLMFEEEAQDREEFIYHRPVLVREAIELLAPRAGALVLDATCGGGGHSEAILKTGADVLALDQDPDAIAEATNRLSEFGNRVTLRKANFRHADRMLDELEVGKIGGAIRDLGEEPAARRIASAIVKQRKTEPFRETLPLARAIEKIVGRHGRRHPATRVFQALRMEVNDELGALEQGLRVVTDRLESGARIAVISFHSLEDRMVKNFFRERSREYVDRPEWPEPRPNKERNLLVITPRPVEPSENEQRFNARARSAKLRVAEKLG